MSAVGWDRIVGQDAAVALLRAAADRPVHSYLLVGPRGSGVEDSARCFAAALVAGDDERGWDLVLRGQHPDVVEIDPATTQIVVGDADRLVREAHASPVEGDRKVVMLLGADRLNDVAANRLLKTIEEPPARTHVVLVAERAERLLPTIRSRCQQVEFAYLGESDVREAVALSQRDREGDADPQRLDLVARLAGGRVDRARRLAGPLGPVRDAFLAAAESLDGTGAAVERASQRVAEAVSAALAALEEHQAEELGALEVELAAAGYPARVVQSRRRIMTDRQKRELRRARTDGWIEGITAIETLYRDVLAGGDAPSLNLDRRSPRVHPRAAADALEACRRARGGLIEFNANEALTVQRLLMHLPAAATVSGGSETGAR